MEKTAVDEFIKMKDNREIMTDEELIKLIQTNHKPAFETLYRRYFSKLYSSVYKRIKSKEITEEIIQDLFTSLWINRQAISINNSFSAYIFTAAKYKVFRFFRDEGFQRELPEMYRTFGVETNNTEETVCVNELAAKLVEAMDHLPGKTKKIYQLSRKEFKSNKEIANQLGITEKAVEYHITKSIGLLKMDLKDFIVFFFLISFLLIK